MYAHMQGCLFKWKEFLTLCWQQYITGYVTTEKERNPHEEQAYERFVRVGRPWQQRIRRKSDAVKLQLSVYKNDHL